MKTITQDELNKKLEDHQTWLQSDGFEGERLNLSGYDLRYLIFRGVNLFGADLRHADLSGADIRGANFSGALLSHAYLRHADLSNALLITLI